MKKETAERFFQNLKWFNDFFSDLRNLFDKIASMIEKELGYNESYYYYSKFKDMPSIPSEYFLLFRGEEKLGLQIVAIFDRDKVTNNRFQVNEPAILVVLHNCKPDNYTWITWNILEGKSKNIREISEDGGLVSGILSWSPEVSFDAFLVPLELFSEYKDQTVKEQIISRINQVLNKRH